MGGAPGSKQAGDSKRQALASGYASSLMLKIVVGP
jgi:hypothetical protein